MDYVGKCSLWLNNLEAACGVFAGGGRVWVCGGEYPQHFSGELGHVPQCLCSSSISDSSLSTRASVSTMKWRVSERMNLVLRERNTVWNKSEEGEDGSESGDEDKEDKPEFNHVIVCG